ncbi:VPLPA-CTERM sorting domain-containing protein [Methylomonas rivi]|uniref:VPLPA-CTERM sorting domain-containing protein n=1 Tax=Methylomonas rivi TaxID=2952226 RepID=A0ABT1U3N9_9GAMM|nr:VPLPA-CTERM sorting domain-containing protein [Methylomonas sp. WSC-6]MCQ8128460.1 VPLPA-CTERM sorting domain-containing protein [Methylomonas sp. WSC-6]
MTIYSTATQHIADSVSNTHVDDIGPTSSTQVAQAAINGSFDYNHLSGYASSSASKSVGHYTWIDNNPNSIFYGTNQGDNTHSSAAANSYIQEYIVDPLTVTSTELQSGTVVELAVDWSLDASFGVTGYPANFNPYGGSPGTPSAQLTIGSDTHTLDYWNNGTNASLSGSYTLHTSVGDMTGLYAVLTIAGGQMNAYQEMFNFETQTTEFTGQNVSSFADATAKFAIRVLTPGASYSAASGNVYATSLAAVPVPSAAWLFASGLLGLFGLKRRR